jgi:lipopolysaccharide transport protein LptA
MADQNAAERPAIPIMAILVMAILVMARAVALIAITLLVSATAGAAAPRLSNEPIDLTADVGTLDPRKDVQELSGNVRIRQGEISMEAQKATGTAMQSDHGRWTFERAVRIRTAEADLKSDSASATFANGQIAEAVAQGTPATFEQRNATADKRVRGRANKIEYDFDKGTVKLTDNVWFAQGGNEFRGDALIYYVRDERVVMNPGGKQSGRVNITIRPRNSTNKSKPAQANPPPAAPKPKSESGA